MGQEDECPFCRHLMSGHNTTQFEGPVCVWCACGDQYVVEPQVERVSVVREVLISAMIGIVIMVVIQIVILLVQDF